MSVPKPVAPPRIRPPDDLAPRIEPADYVIYQDTPAEQIETWLIQTHNYVASLENERKLSRQIAARDPLDTIDPNRLSRLMQVSELIAIGAARIEYLSAAATAAPTKLSLELKQYGQHLATIDNAVRQSALLWGDFATPDLTPFILATGIGAGFQLQRQWQVISAAEQAINLLSREARSMFYRDMIAMIAGYKAETVMEAKSRAGRLAPQQDMGWQAPPELRGL